MKPDLSSLPEWSRPWAEHRLIQVPHDISGEQWNHLRDWLTALPIERPKMPLKLHKLTMAQALEASARWHEDIARQAERIRDDRSSFGGDPDAVEVLSDSGNGWRWVRVNSPEGLDYEGNAMGHCVGRGGYDTGVTIISLRDKHNMPHCTIEWNEDSRSVKQVQGRANGPVVEKYHRSVVAFVNGLEPLAVQGAGKFDHVFVDGKLVHWSEMQDGLTLEKLDLAGCTSLTHLPNGLNAKHIDLRGCTGLTQLPDGLNLESLTLSGCTSLTHLPDGLTARYIDLRDCNNLTYLPDELIVHSLYLSGCTGLTHLPDGLSADVLYLSGCTGITYLPDGFNRQYLDLSGCTGLTHLPYGLNVKTLNLSGCTGMTQLPDGLIARHLNLSGCTGMTQLPDVLIAGHLDLKGCTGLIQLPDGLDAKILYLEGCTGLTHLPDEFTAENLYLNGCTNLTHLPDKLSVEILDLSNCTGLTHLPDGLTAEYLDLTGCTGLTSLPSDLNVDCRVRGGDHLIRRSTPRTQNPNTSILKAYCSMLSHVFK